MTTEPIDQPSTAVPAPALPDICCARCAHFTAGPAPDQPSYCRRFPPTPFMVNMQWNQEKTQITNWQMISSHATVHPFGRCGEFVRAQAEVN